MVSPIDCAQWHTLAQHYATCQHLDMRELFAADATRAQRYTRSCANLRIDYSKNLITDSTLAKLLALAQAMQLPEQIKNLFSGEFVNFTEGRPALHTALRSPESLPICYQGENVTSQIQACLQQMQAIVEKIRDGAWHGCTGKPIRNIVNIGVGGSHLGTALIYEACAEYAHPEISVHFLTETDPAYVARFLEKLAPETTAFIIATKSFQTVETLVNANRVKEWLSQQGDPTPHLFAITANIADAKAFGMSPQQIFPIWDWVGGRYSVWSAMGLAAAISIGFDNFCELLAGAHATDQHFANTPLIDNVPVLLALIEIWYINFFKAQTRAVLPYTEQLRLLPYYLQQLEMESNGKSIDKDGQTIDYSTSAVIWGEVGTRAQHSFMQLLHQGTHFIPVDFVVPKAANTTPTLESAATQAISQSQALLNGADPISNPHAKVCGNRPSNMILLPDLSPRSIGSLLALYEHKVFAQSVIWNINSFDQPGVELGKTLAKSLVDQKANAQPTLDNSTSALLAYLYD